jgi:hypothetical protein
MTVSMVFEGIYSSADPDEVGFSSKRLSQHPTSNGVFVSCADMSEEYLRYPRTPLEPVACRPRNEASAVSHPCTATSPVKRQGGGSASFGKPSGNTRIRHKGLRLVAAYLGPLFYESCQVQAYTGLLPTVC